MSRRAPPLDRIRLTGFAILLLTCLSVAVAYAPGLHGPFVFDDEINIDSNPSVTQFTPSVDGIARIADSDRPLSYLSLALNYYAADGSADSFPYKLTNLIVHLINTALVYWLSVLLVIQLQRRRIGPNSALHYLPALTAALWALHPLQLTSVLYVVQRMTSLSATAVLIGLITFMVGRQLETTRDRRGIPLMWLGLTLGAVIGFGFKENATLIVLYAGVVEYVFFHDAWRKNDLRRRLLLAYSVPLLVLGAAAFWWLVRHPATFAGIYDLREFTPIQRLLTEARVLWFYVSLIVAPASYRFTLFHDDIQLSTSLLAPWTTLPALIALLFAVVFALVTVKKLRLLSFGILWFLAGHSMESSLIGLELVHEHRNYIPSIGLIFSLAYALCYGFGYLRQRTLMIGVWITLLTGLGATTFALANVWADQEDLIRFMLRHRPDSTRTQVMAADWYFIDRREPLPAIAHYVHAAELDPHESAYLLRAVYLAARTELSIFPTPDLQKWKVLSDTDWTLTQRGQHLRIAPRAALMERISQRVTQQPVHHRTAKALEEIAVCVTQQPQYCGDLREPLLRWYRLAIDNPRGTDTVRIDLLISVVGLELERRNFEQAVFLARRAREIDSHNPTLALMEANVQILAGNRSEAHHVLQTLLADPTKLTVEQRAAANELRRMMDDSVGKPRTNQDLR